MARTEIQVLVARDGVMILIDRCTLDSENVKDAAEQYAALFEVR